MIDPLYYLQELHVGNRKEIYRDITGNDDLYNSEKAYERDSHTYEWEQ